MLLSMTGHGDASGQNERIGVTAEVRSVNNRHLKISLRCPDPFLALESNVDRVVREMVSRGTFTIHLRVRQLGDLSAYHLNPSVARQYLAQMREMCAEMDLSPPATIDSLLSLPGIVGDGETRAVQESDWPLLEEVLVAAMRNLQEFRREEGQNMATELKSLLQIIEDNAEQIALQAPAVIVDYRDRLKTRVNDLLASNSVKVTDNDLIREVSLFADRCDITEELMRLRSHIQQYRNLLEGEGSNGRKLEFLGQELFREINTTGSKANNIDIAHRVVEMKAAIEKMREIILNVE
ncbi:YicC/YloC family endoribonuclease [Planctomicrobium sp. SH668]|uniref:YicC/YloC family endoribonuclease n=1 Tax=Planctomicrobium sp. SH668 TaxID=3448126 RepID=UPI003F5B2645